MFKRADMPELNSWYESMVLTNYLDCERQRQNYMRDSLERLTLAYEKAIISGQFQEIRRDSQMTNSSHSTPNPLDQLSLLRPVGINDLGETMSQVTSSDDKNTVSEEENDQDNLKFGINRILSKDFGKRAQSPEPHCLNKYLVRSNWEEDRQNLLSIQPFAYSSYFLSLPSPSALHAVNSIKPPNYPAATGEDCLPGPYSILGADSSLTNQRRKRSWSRAVFSQLQRKGLEKRFEIQKYVTKPDRRKLAASLGLTDAQVKVWFQNRRMKWRHGKSCESSEQVTNEHGEIYTNTLDSSPPSQTD